MSSHIKHMDKIDAQHLSNFKHPNVSTFCWYNFYCAKFYFKKFKISLSRMELPNAFSIDFLFIFFNSKTLTPLEIIATAVAQKKKRRDSATPATLSRLRHCYVGSLYWAN